MIVNERLARRLWPGESAVGKRLVSGSAPPADGRWQTVIGVVRDVRREGLEQAPILTAYIPTYSRGMDFTVRAGPAQIPTLGPLVRAELRALDGTVPLPQITVVRDRLAIRLGARRFESQALGLFAASPAYGDGDPASYILVAESVYFGYGIDLRSKEAARLVVLLEDASKLGIDTGLYQP